MKKIAALFVTFLMSINIVWAQGGIDDLEHIRKLTQEKKYAEALAAHQQFFEASRSTSGMAGVRLSFALSDWIELGRVYPPALYALSNLSAGHRKVILEGESNVETFHEYRSINEYLDKNQETVETFLELEEKFPELAKDYYPSMKRVLIAQNRIDVVSRHVNDPIYEYENIRNMREYSLSQLRKNDSSYNLQSINRNFERDVKALVDVTSKVGMKDEAEEIKHRAETYMKGNLLRKYH